MVDTNQPIDSDIMDLVHHHFFYVMEVIEKLSEKVDELEQNITIILMVQAKLIEERMKESDA